MQLALLVIVVAVLPPRKRKDSALHHAIDIQTDVAEAKAVEASKVAENTIAYLLKIAGKEVSVTSINRSGSLRCLSGR